MILISDGNRCLGKYALPCAQHLVPMTISSAEGRFGIIKPLGHIHKSLTSHGVYVWCIQFTANKICKLLQQVPGGSSSVTMLCSLEA